MVNVKLSDYGISKFNTSGGTVGLVGTPGYQAPEIMDGLAYDEKVNIHHSVISHN
jgi:leucine-rich repeat kinase 1